MSHKWVPQGVADYEPHEISGDVQEAIRARLRDRDNLNFPALFDKLGQAVAQFKSQSSLVEPNKPSVIRKSLRRASSSAASLADELRQFSGTTRALMAQVDRDFTTDKAILNIRRIAETLRNALELADQNSRGGRLPDFPRRILACDVAHIYEQHLLQRPAITEGGLYEEILELVLYEATGSEPQDVHGLAQRALGGRETR